MLIMLTLGTAYDKHQHSYWLCTDVRSIVVRIAVLLLPKNRSPTIGEYDKLAIRYGYTHMQSPLDAGTEQILEDPGTVLEFFTIVPYS